jgi:predicted ATPase/class 3 adenylate cyclase
VTFAFTDIEGSTQRWERDRAAMDRALQRHDAILRTAILGHGGAVFKTVGDAFCAAFSLPADAVAAIVAAQRALAAEDFSAVDGLRIRAALHTGTAEERGGDYFGPPVNRVARLLGIAAGGQVLVSDATRSIAEHALPADTTLRDLGRHRLKDLIEPEHVFQLVVPDLPADFPALRSLESLHHNLPQQTTALIGRDDEVAAISALVASHRLVTVVGSGGVGKTRTTLQVGANLLDGSGDGVWFVELAPVTNADYLPAAVAQAMGLHLAADGAPLDALVRALKPKRALLIFDNCEHVIDGASHAIGVLLRTCPQLTILASSRQALGIAGEATFRMPSLATPAPGARLTATDAGAYAAIALFTDRAAAADRRFALTDANAPAVADICRRLDGIPLAIELAAARVKLLSPKQLLDRLDERFRVLTGGSRDAMPRQQTLYALIDWSHDLLDERERALFRRLGIFVDGFTLDGAVAVGAIDGLDELDVLDVLQSLVDKSLVATEPHDDAPRYRLLESTRAYARDKLRAAGEETRAADLHAAYIAALAARAYREFDSALPPGWLERNAAEIDDLRAALDYTLEGPGDRARGASIAADSGPIFLRMELLGEGLRWCDAARAVIDVPAATRGRIEYVASMMHNNLGESRSGLACAERAVSLYEGSGDERGLVRALSQVAQFYARSGRIDEARAPAAAALARARALREPHVLSAVLRRCAFSLPAPEIDEARRFFAEALSIARSMNDPGETSMVLDWWASREAAAGSLARAIELDTEALTYTPLNGHVFVELHIAGWALALNRLDDAAPHAQRGLLLARAADNPHLLAYAIACCAPRHAERAPDEAAMAFGYATARLREAEWEASDDDELALRNASDAIGRALDATAFAALLESGTVWTEDAAVAAILAGFSSDSPR